MSGAIRTPARRLRVFVSSTLAELAGRVIDSGMHSWERVGVRSWRPWR
jgi:hypothetical protein